jgi:hypothetical protein
MTVIVTMRTKTVTYLVLVKLPAGRVVLARVTLNTDASLAQSLPYILRIFKDLLSVGFANTRGETDGNNCNLIFGYTRWPDGALVVGVNYKLKISCK